MNKEGGRGYTVTTLVVLGILALLVIGAMFFPSFKRMTGFASTTSPVTISVAIAGSNAPLIYVYNGTMTSIAGGPNEGPAQTNLMINLTAYDADGIANLNVSSATVNFTKSGEQFRFNNTCTNTVNYSTYYANFTCNVTMYWYDGTGSWSIYANVSDLNSNAVTNGTTNFQVGATDGFVTAPTTLTWASLTAGSTNQSSTNDPMLLNNTGNVNKFININSTNLRGESTPGLALWAGNFTVNVSRSFPGVNMTDHTYVNITSAALPKGNFTINNNATGQEQLYFNIYRVGSELIAQTYSTTNESTWTVQIVTQA